MRLSEHNTIAWFVSFAALAPTPTLSSRKLGKANVFSAPCHFTLPDMYGGTWAKQDRCFVFWCLAFLTRFYARRCSPIVAQGKHEEADVLYKRAIAIREKVYGPDHQEVAFLLSNRAKLLQNRVRNSPTVSAWPEQRVILQALRDRFVDPRATDVALFRI